MESEPLPLILDVDTGIDDMVALLIAATAPELNLRGVTCVAGNVEIHHVARNTGKILQMVGRADVPVSIGAARPLQRRLRTAPETHGPTGTGYVELRGEDRKLGSTDYTPIPAPRYLGAHIKRHPGQITILALGPLTNLAAAALNGVDLVDGTREIVWMGGTLEERGNTTDTGEWNACVDPDRFYIGFHREADGINGCYLHDPVTLIGALLRPDLVSETVSERLAVDTGADPYVAGSLFRAGDDDERPPVDIAIALDADGMKEELLARLGRAVAAEVA